MDSALILEFAKQAEELFPSIRGGILVCARRGDIYGQTDALLRHLEAIKSAAVSLGLTGIINICQQFKEKLKANGSADAILSDEKTRCLLDTLAELEAAVAELYFGDGGFAGNASDFVEKSFRHFQADQKICENRSVSAEATDEFEIDQEMREIFAVEAGELIESFAANLKKLETLSNDSEALLEMRRNAHTLKGSAAIIGLKKLSAVAHRVEDLLDFLAANEIRENSRIFKFLSDATDCFQSLARDEDSELADPKIARLYTDFEKITTAFFAHPETAAVVFDRATEPEKSKTTQPPIEQTFDETARISMRQNRPVVRVSLDKLDYLVKLTADLLANRKIFEQHLVAFGSQLNSLQNNRQADENAGESTNAVSANCEQPPLETDLTALFDNQQRLIEEINRNLRRLRMVPFGSLAGRLQRTVRVTCEEEEKFAELILDGENFEIDTQILDCLIEPLLHLLRNAVAHGIEAPELRRLLGKPEKGRISISLSEADSQILVTVADDGRGISVDALKEKAIANNSIARQNAETMTLDESFELIFLPGLTTAENLSQVSGRGIGMNIVKTDIERQGGTIRIGSEAQKGTIFTIRLPTAPVGSAIEKAATTAPAPPASLRLVKQAGEALGAEPFAGTTQSSVFGNRQIMVLAVDDSEFFRQAISRLIRNAGGRCVTSIDGTEALEILQSGARLPDVILTDVEMPRADGFQLLTALRNQKALASIPVIIITSRNDRQTRQKAVDLGASDYLAKPFEDADLLAKIKNLV